MMNPCVCCGTDHKTALTDWNWATGDKSRFGGICDSCLARRRRLLFLKEQSDIRAQAVAQIIGMRGWHDEIGAMLTVEEHTEIKAVWNTMGGGSCWYDALLHWMRTPDVGVIPSLAC